MPIVQNALQVFRLKNSWIVQRLFEIFVNFAAENVDLMNESKTYPRFDLFSVPKHNSQVFDNNIDTLLFDIALRSSNACDDSCL